MEGLSISAIKTVAKQAGDILLKYRGGNLAIQTKVDETDLVTRADKESDQFIRNEITKLFPTDQILSEETESNIKDFFGRVWIIDPLDGTMHYIAGEDTFSVMIGLAIDGKSTFGLVYAPALNTYYWAEKSLGAWKQDPNGKVTKISVNATSSPDNLRLAVSPSFEDTQFISSLKAQEHIKIASGGLKASAIAQGLADATFFTGRNMGKWDFCASDIIINEAGGILTDSSGNPIDFSVSNDQFPKALICSNGKIHRALVQKYQNYNS